MGFSNDNTVFMDISRVVFLAHGLSLGRLTLQLCNGLVNGSPLGQLQTEDIIRTRDGPMCGSFGHLVFCITKYLVTVSEGKVKPLNSNSPWLERKVIKDQITKAVSCGGQ